MPYSTDIFGGCDGLFICLATWANSVTEGMYWSIILMTFGIILFMATFTFGVNRAFGFSTISVSFVALILVQINLIPLWVLTLTIVLACVGLAVMFMNQR